MIIHLNSRKESKWKSIFKRIIEKKLNIITIKKQFEIVKQVQKNFHKNFYQEM